MNAPYSQCDAKGRCIRHPTIRMSRKKKLGGWKKLLSLCPMCAMELMNEDGAVGSGVGGVSSAYCGEVGGASSPPPPSRGGRGGGHPRSGSGSRPEPPSSRSYSDGSSSFDHQQRQRRAPRIGHHDQDDRSVDRSVLSAPSTYGRGRSDHQAARPPVTKRGSINSAMASDSSCDTTVDLSYASEQSSHSGGMLRRMDSSGEVSVHSQRSSGSRRSARSGGSRQDRGPRGQPMPYHYDAPFTPNTPTDHGYENTIEQNQEQFVCGMEFYIDDRRCFYTGQIHAETRLPHGLGTLRSESDRSMLEGEWSMGRLMQESHGAGRQEYAQEYVSHGDQHVVVSPLEYPEEHQDGEWREEEYDCRNYADYCLPCTNDNTHQADRYEESLCEDLGACEVATDEDESSISNSVAQTINDCDTQSNSSGSSSGRRSYTARESKVRDCSATYDRLKEYERYIDRCDEEGDHYLNEPSQSTNPHYERPKRVRFQEDP